MSVSEFRDNLARLRAAAAEFARQRELAEARVAEVNPVIRQLTQARFAAAGQQVTGPIVECWPHPESDTATYNVAAIQVPQGIGAVQFDLPFGEEPDEQTFRSFVAFAECEPSVQAKLVPHIDNLVAELLRVLDIPAA
jgi:hypothetical protein